MGTWSITQRWQIFIQTHSLPAFVQLGSNTASPPQPGIHKDRGLRLKKPTCYFIVTGLNHCTGWEQVSEHSERVLFCPPITAATVS